MTDFAVRISTVNYNTSNEISAFLPFILHPFSSPADDSTRFLCSCPASYAGRLCQDRLSPCDPNPCQNQGACIPDITKPNNLFCTCLPGYTGRLCETLVPRCTPADNPCQNGGTCRELGAAKFECRCTMGFEGTLC